MIKNPALFIGGRYASLRSRNLLVGFISILSVCGLALGVAVLITVLSVMNGFDREMQQRILGLVPHITVTTARNDRLQTEEEWQPLRDAINSVQGVIGTAPYLQLQGMLLVNGNTKGVLLSGVDPVQEDKVSVINEFMEEGSLNSLQEGEYGIAIGSNLAEQLEVTVGDNLTLVSTVVPITPLGEYPRQKRFTVQAIFSVGSQLDANLALVHIADAQLLYRLGNHIHGYRVQTDDLFAVGEITDRLRAVLPETLNFSDWRFTYGSLYENIIFSKTLVGLLLSLLVAVAAFNVIVSLIMVVREKQGDIAILRTMGISLGAIKSIFLVQGFIIGLIGTVGGLVLGILFSLVVGDAVAWLQSILGTQFLSSEVYPVNYLPSEIRLGDLALVCSLALVLSLLATLYPAARAARTRPAEILRYE
jgi:lipoprotein-releasing system permease protein